MSDLTGYKIPTEDVIFTLPAHLYRVNETRAVDLLALAKADRALDPSVFEEAAPFFLTAELSNQQLDSHYTRMDMTSLNNFAADAKAGIPLQDSHDTYRMSLGRSLTGMVEQGPKGARVISDFYVLSGVKFNGGSYASSDDFIRQVRGGIAHDGSIGFCFKNTDPNTFAGVRCDICRLDLYTWDCPHIPGMTYEATDDAGNVSRMMCTGTVMNAHAAEWSSVYSGSTPDSAIIKAQYEAAAGRMKPETARFLEQRYRGINLKLAPAQFALGGIEGDRSMEPNKDDEVKRHPDDVAQANNIRGLLTKAGFAENQDPLEAIRVMTDELGTLRAVKDELPELRKQAADGVLYRKSRVDRAWAEYVRFSAAKGVTIAAGAEAGKRAVWERMSIADVDAIADSYDEYSTAKLGGGRQTSDGAEEQPPARRAEPVNAYRV